MNKTAKEKSSALISVIMPVYNGEKYLEEAIRSVLDQSYRSFEFILVDDGSEDNSARIARRHSPPLLYTFQRHQGLSAARNRGVALAKGEYLSWLDADDVWEKDKLEKQMAAFDSRPGLEMVFGHMRQFFTPEMTEEERRKIRLDAGLIPGYSLGSLLIKREAFFEAGNFELKWELGADTQWLLRAQEKGLRSLMLPDLVFRRRIHSSNMGRIKKQFQHHYLKIIKESLDRRREGGRSGDEIRNKTK